MEGRWGPQGIEEASSVCGGIGGQAASLGWLVGSGRFGSLPHAPGSGAMFSSLVPSHPYSNNPSLPSCLPLPPLGITSFVPGICKHW